MVYLCLLLAPLAFIASLFGTRACIAFLPRLRAIDTPNARSNHKKPVPRGGGIAVVCVLIAGFGALGMNPLILAMATCLAIISFADDMRPLPAYLRFGAQIIAAGFALHTLPGRILPDSIPYAFEFSATLIAWLWFINLTNFMDGIDGITSLQIMAMMLGIMCVSLFAATHMQAASYACVFAAATFGFYVFNHHPARIFLGDVGSIPMGFFAGLLLLLLARAGFLAAAFILPAYYITDATLTLIRRLLRGEPVWKAHSEHAYQRAVRAGLSHTQVTRRISLLNLLLVVLAMLSALSMMHPALSALLVLLAYLASYLLTYRFCHVSHAQ